MEEPDAPERDSDIVFHYSREHRLKKASRRVRAMYEDTPKKPRFGLFSSLVDSKPKAILFAAIVLFCVIVLLLFPPAQ
ncbi:MAG: hypothetical protein LBH50_05375 [Spirochaetaceae bacterium]|jgi:hypothetical protein|nr:hypothetical protein [Spirochaetaceae bacterium]